MCICNAQLLRIENPYIQDILITNSNGRGLDMKAVIVEDEIIAKMLAMFNKEKKVYKSFFLIPHKDKFIPLSVNDIAYIYSENKVAKIVTFDKRTFYESNS